MNKWVSAAAAAFGGWVAFGEARARTLFRGKVVLITGASRGLGLVLARHLVRRGAKIAICARDGAELEQARTELASSGGEVFAVACDVSDATQARTAVEQTVRRFGRLDVLINNAGIISVAPQDQMGLTDYREAMEINYFGMVHTTIPALPHLIKSRGRIVNITSIGAAVPIPHLLPYTASKYAARGFSEGLCAEVRRHGVRVTTVLPGIMRTGSFVRALFKGRRDREFTWFSLGASLPIVAVSANRAARSILAACARGQVHFTVGLPAKVLRLVHALVPGPHLRLLSLVNRVLLPEPGGAGVGAPAEPGWLHRSTPSALTRLGDEAARENREVPWASPT